MARHTSYNYLYTADSEGELPKISLAACFVHDVVFSAYGQLQKNMQLDITNAQLHLFTATVCQLSWERQHRLACLS